MTSYRKPPFYIYLFSCLREYFTSSKQIMWPILDVDIHKRSLKLFYNVSKAVRIHFEQK